jgi:hypothetical protein
MPRSTEFSLKDQPDTAFSQAPSGIEAGVLSREALRAPPTAVAT